MFQAGRKEDRRGRLRDVALGILVPGFERKAKLLVQGRYRNVFFFFCTEHPFLSSSLRDSTPHRKGF